MGDIKPAITDVELASIGRLADKALCIDSLSFTISVDQFFAIKARIDDEQAKRRAAEAAQADLQQKLTAARTEIDMLHMEIAEQAAELADLRRTQRAAP